jgi:UDP-glucose 4-epimerase
MTQGIKGIRPDEDTTDLCEPNLRALHYPANGGTSDTFKLGKGLGFSVQEVIETAQRITARMIRTGDAPRNVV